MGRALDHSFDQASPRTEVVQDRGVRHPDLARQGRESQGIGTGLRELCLGSIEDELMGLLCGPSNAWFSAYLVAFIMGHY